MRKEMTNRVTQIDIEFSLKNNSAVCEVENVCCSYCNFILCHVEKMYASSERGWKWFGSANMHTVRHLCVLFRYEIRGGFFSFEQNAVNFSA